MADGKRGSGPGAGGKAATPRSAAQGPGDLDEVLTKAVGAVVKLTTAAPNPLTLEGTIYTACRITNILALNTSSTSSSASASTPGDYHLIPISRIQSFNVVSLPSRLDGITASTSAITGFEDVQPPVTRIDLKALKAREEAAIRKMKEKDATRGKGVTKEAQEIYDALARTLPTRWHETSIIVNDAVIISQPYGPENCTAPKDQQNMLARIKKVLENERRKIAERSGKGGAGMPPPVGMRKGG